MGRQSDEPGARNRSKNTAGTLMPRAQAGSYTAPALTPLHSADLASLPAHQPDEERNGQGRYLAVFEMIPLALAVVDDRLSIVRANARFRAMFGMADEPSARRFVHEVFPVGESDLMAAIISARRGLPGVSTSVLLRVGTDGRAVMASCLATPGETVDTDVLVVLREVDAPAAQAPEPAGVDHGEDALARKGPAGPGSHAVDLGSMEHARSRERRLAAVGLLAAGVMHDVNNALNPIVAAAYLLNLHADDPEMVRHYAARVAAAAETGAATAARVGRMLRQEPVEDAQERPIELSVLTDEVIAMTRPLWEQRARGGRVELVRQLEPGIWTMGVAGEVREALLNLVHNALDAMEDGGTLKVRCCASGDRAVLEVEDDGVGMDSDVVERAFDPFFTTKGTRGSGLGLAEVNGVMRRHKGHSELRSSPGDGTLVRLLFPRASAAEEPSRRQKLQRVSRRVLVVEDNLDNREFMRALLRSDGHSVEVAPGVADALALLSQRQGGRNAFDLVVSDVGLLDGSGWDLVHAIRERWPLLQVGIVTGWDLSSETAEDADFILRKPIRTESLLAAVSADR
ncbi:MAG TPA: ATP-binding protein [Gemmatimonadales bacterium]|nr:ATP-binding protein [Gemmatimonadales bacterium]